jgi:glutamate-ammonia-ligase adenylyltransferase
LSDSVTTCADPRRARHYLELLRHTSARANLEAYAPEAARTLCSVLAGSQTLSELLVAHPDWLGLIEPEQLRYPRRKQGLRKEVSAWLPRSLEKLEFHDALVQLRVFKQRQMLRIGARDLARFGRVPDIILELSDLADVCLDTVWQVCQAQLEARYGRPYHQDANNQWRPTHGVVLGMGKLGGQELNYSSDVDVLFLYSEEGSVFRVPPSSKKPGKPTLTSHRFFNRLAEAFIAEVGRMTPEGTLYRIDLRLRPEGDAGPLTRSLAGYENYYAQWGQTWERMMLIKARAVAGDEVLAAEFLEMIQPFRYPRSINAGVLGEVAAMKARIESEVVRAGEVERNVKLGRGGIREVEFIVQALQLLRAGRQPFLQGAQTLPALEKLAQYELLSHEESRLLRDAYCFLREIEHRLQMEANLQTHTIPHEKASQERLARLMAFPALNEFSNAYRHHTSNVRRIFDKLFKAESEEPLALSPFPRQYIGPAASAWKRILSDHGFKDNEKAMHLLREFVEGPGYVHVSPRTSDLAFQLLPRLFALCPQPRAATTPKAAPLDQAPAQEAAPMKGPLSDPDRVVTRLDSFVSAYGARATLFELWNRNPAILELLLLLFDRSEFLAELAIRTPDLVDELVVSGRLRQRKPAAETLRDLRHGLDDPDQHLWLRRYHQAELMRIGLRDILGLADFEQYLTELSALADACLQYALELVLRRHKLKKPPFVVIGLGKLGGREIDYGSDLDLVFVANPKARNLPRLAVLALELMDLVSRRTEHGIVFQTDARLRPDGAKGLLVNSLKAYEDYYRHRAQLWEVQSLTRTRPIAGDMHLGDQFQKLTAALTNFAQPSLPLAAFNDSWRGQIHQMRLRIQKERSPQGQDDLAIKTGRGGLMDAEFIAQVCCMAHGWLEANTLRALERAQQAGAVPDAEKLITNYRELRRIEGILRRWSYEGETVLPEDPAPYLRVSVRCGFAKPEAFRAAMANCRDAIRKVYLKVFQVKE